MSFESMKLMVNALQDITSEPDRTLQQRPERYARAREAIEAGRQAIADAEKQEPCEASKVHRASAGDYLAKQSEKRKKQAHPAQPKAEQEQDEPVAIYQYQKGDGSWIDQEKQSYDYNVKHGHATVRVVYTTPPQRKPLTDEQIGRIAKEHIAVGTRSFEDFARRIEAAHGIKPV